MNRWMLILVLALPAAAVQAETPQQILDQLSREAGGASASRGAQFYKAKQGGGEAESCAACHTLDPRQAGQHVKTHKAIEPLAPVANKERFTDPAKVEKWFKRNCKEVLGRACTPQEKADFTAYVLSAK
jgi:cytochrome c